MCDTRDMSKLVQQRISEWKRKQFKICRNTIYSSIRSIAFKNDIYSHQVSLFQFSVRFGSVQFSSVFLFQNVPNVCWNLEYNMAFLFCRSYRIVYHSLTQCSCRILVLYVYCVDGLLLICFDKTV